MTTLGVAMKVMICPKMSGIARRHPRLRGRRYVIQGSKRTLLQLRTIEEPWIKILSNNFNLRQGLRILFRGLSGNKHSNSITKTTEVGSIP